MQKLLRKYKPIFAYHHTWGPYAKIGGQQVEATHTSDVIGKWVYDERKRKYINIKQNRIGWGNAQEPSRTNFCSNSRAIAESSWVAVGVTKSADQGLGLDGITQVDKITENGSLDRHMVTFAGGSTAANEVVAWSARVKRINGTRHASMKYHATFAFESYTFEVGFNLNTLTATKVDSEGTHNYIDAGVKKLDNGWFEIWCVGSVGAANVDLSVGMWDGVAGDIEYTGDSSSSILIDFCQAELDGSYFRSSPIVVTSKSVTRSADAMRWILPNVFGRCAKQGTLLCVFDTSYMLSDLDDDTKVCTLNNLEGTANYVLVHCDAFNNILESHVRSNSSTQATLTASILGDFASKITVVVLVTWEKNNFKFYVNGILEGTDSSGNEPVDLDRIEVGSRNAGFQRCGGNLYNVQVFDKVISVDEAKVLTRDPEQLKWAC